MRDIGEQGWVFYKEEIKYAKAELGSYEKSIKSCQNVKCKLFRHRIDIIIF